jgi:hypothetical protein
MVGVLGRVVESSVFGPEGRIQHVVIKWCRHVVEFSRGCCLDCEIESRSR